MTKRLLTVGAVAVVALAGAAVATRSLWSPEGASAQSTRGPAAVRTVLVEVAIAVKKPVPVRIDALATVVPIASVAIKSRLETEIIGVHFPDGGTVKQGDLLFTLDGRSLEAQIRQAEGVLARDRAQLEGAERDVARYTELVAKKATPQINLDNAKTQADTFRANIKADQAALDNLKVQLSYCTIRAPISGQISAAAVKVGNFVRPSDTAPLVVINQIAPIYVAFGLPQRILPETRVAIDEGSATIEAIIPGEARHATGRVTMIDNNVDAATGMVMLRATMDNPGEILWPGALVMAQLTLRIQEAVVVPTAAVQVSQTGTYVFVVKDDAVSVRPVTVDRAFDSNSIISQGLEGGETVVTDGQLQLTSGTKVTTREAKAGT